MGNAAQMTTIEINDDVPHPNNLEQNETYENEERFTFTIAGFNTKFNPKTFGAIILFAAIVVALGIFLLSPFENSIVRVWFLAIIFLSVLK